MHQKGNGNRPVGYDDEDEGEDAMACHAGLWQCFPRPQEGQCGIDDRNQIPSGDTLAFLEQRLLSGTVCIYLSHSYIVEYSFY